MPPPWILALVAAVAALPACLGAEQTAACQQFVACVRELDGRDRQTTDAIRFEPDGDCWGGPTIAELCDHACTRGLEPLRATAPPLACLVTP